MKLHGLCLDNAAALVHWPAAAALHALRKLARAMLVIGRESNLAAAPPFDIADAATSRAPSTRFPASRFGHAKRRILEIAPRFAVAGWSAFGKPS